MPGKSLATPGFSRDWRRSPASSPSTNGERVCPITIFGTADARGAHGRCPRSNGCGRFRAAPPSSATSEGGNNERSSLRPPTPNEHVNRARSVRHLRQANWSADYPWAPKPAEARAMVRAHRDRVGRHGRPVDTGAKPRRRRRRSPNGGARTCVSVRALARRSRWAVPNTRVSTSVEVLTAICVPTLVLHRRGDHDVKIEEARSHRGPCPQRQAG